jgi:hypothetical protein
VPSSTGGITAATQFIWTNPRPNPQQTQTYKELTNALLAVSAGGLDDASYRRPERARLMSKHLLWLQDTRYRCEQRRARNSFLLAAL